MKYNKECKICNKTFLKDRNISVASWFGTEKRPNGVQYCSVECRNIGWLDRIPWNKGKEGLQNWTKEQKEKVSLLWEKKRELSKNFKFSGSKWSNTRKRVLKRDDYTCQECGYKEPEIMCVDHIFPKSIYPELTYKMDNCITLCPNCHARKTIQDKKMIKEITTIANA